MFKKIKITKNKSKNYLNIKLKMEIEKFFKNYWKINKK